MNYIYKVDLPLGTGDVLFSGFTIGSPPVTNLVTLISWSLFSWLGLEMKRRRKKITYKRMKSTVNTEWY